MLDSLAPVKLIPDNATVMDMGSGGGFPGIPMKIAKPSLRMTFLDAVRKKVNFIRHVLRTLNLSGCEAVCGRVEDSGVVASLEQKFDIVACRSFAPMNRLVPWAIPFLAPHGRIIALKGKNVHSEILEMSIKNYNNLIYDEKNYDIAILPYQTSRDDVERYFAVIQKDA